MQNAAAMKKMPCASVTGDHRALCVHVCVGAFIWLPARVQACSCVHAEVQIGGVEEAGGQEGSKQSL